jgi:hypothetical protein
MSPREPNDDWRVFSAISMIYGIAEQSFVKQVTPDRFFWRGLQVFLTAGRQERIGDFRVGIRSAGVGFSRDRRWVRNFSHGESPRGRESPGGRETAKGAGCRCSSMPWRNFPGPIFGACRAIRRCWSRRVPNWRIRCRPAHPISACETRLGKKLRLAKTRLGKKRVWQFLPHRFHSPAICSRGCWPRSIPRSLASPRVM